MLTKGRAEKRVVVYIDRETHRSLKAKLAKQDSNLSEWFRNKADEEVKGGKNGR